MPKDYRANSITDTGTLQHDGYKMEKTDKLLNMAVVPDGSRARVHFGGGKKRIATRLVSEPSRKIFLVRRGAAFGNG